MRSWKLDEQLVSGLPETRKRPYTLGAPSIDEFYAAIAKHRNRRGTAKRPRTPPALSLVSKRA